MMKISVRMADATDREELKDFYSREGFDFEDLMTKTPPTFSQSETMYIVAQAEDMIVAALRLSIGREPGLGKVGIIQHFEVEDELEETELGPSMLQEAIRIAEDKGLRALDTVVRADRKDVIQLYKDAKFEVDHKEVHLRRKFRKRVFT